MVDTAANLLKSNPIGPLILEMAMQFLNAKDLIPKASPSQNTRSQQSTAISKM